MSVSTQNLGRDAEVAQAESLTEVVPRSIVMRVVSGDSDFPQYFTHPVKIAHLLWDTATPSSLVTNDVFNLWFTSMDSRLQNKIKSFYYMTGTLNIRVIGQGAAQYFGQLRLVFSPRPRLPPAQTVNAQGYVDPSALVNSAILPHVTVDPSKNHTYELELPCPTPVGYWTPAAATDSNNLGSYRMEWVLINIIRSGTAAAPTTSTGVNVCVYAYLTDANLIGLTMTSLASKETKASDLFGTVSGVTKALAPFAGSLSPAVTLFSTASGAASSVLKAFGYSGPPQQNQEAFIQNRTCDNYSQVDGTSTAIVLGASQSQGVSIDPSVGLGKLEDMSIDHICAQPSLLFNDLLLTNAIAAEALYTQFVVTPSMAYALSPNQQIGPLAAMSAVHAYWCGDLTYTFEFVASVFSRATVVIAWSPMGSSATAAAPTMQQAINTLKSVTVQVVGNTSVDITIPYKSIYPASYCANLIGATPSSDQTNEGYTNGVVFVYVLNPVVDNGSTTPSIAYNVWVRSDNISFFCPTTERNGYATTLFMAGSEMVETTQSVMFGGRTDVHGVNLIAFGDRSSSVKHLASRMTFYDNAGKANAASINWQAYTIPNIPAIISSANSTINPAALPLHSFMATAFLGYRGSLKYTMECIPAGSQANTLAKVQVMHMPLSSSTFTSGVNTGNNITNVAGMNPSGTYAWTQPNLEVSSRVDVTVPMLFPGYFYPCRTAVDSARDCVMFMGTFRSWNLASGDSIHFMLYAGAGDDAVYSWFLGFPKFTTLI